MTASDAAAPLESKLASDDPDVAAATFADKDRLAGAEAGMWKHRSRKEKRARSFFFFFSFFEQAMPAVGGSFTVFEFGSYLSEPSPRSRPGRKLQKKKKKEEEETLSKAARSVQRRPFLWKAVTKSGVETRSWFLKRRFSLCNRFHSHMTHVRDWYFCFDSVGKSEDLNVYFSVTDYPPRHGVKYCVVWFHSQQ